MSSENYSNCVRELDLDMCKDYFITKLVYDDGSVTYRVAHLKSGFSCLGKVMLFDNIHAVLDFIANN